MKVRRLLTILTTIAGSMIGMAVMPAAISAPGNRCVLPYAYSNTAPAYADFRTCSYTAAGPGTFAAQGSPWCLKVTRGTSVVQQVCAQSYDYFLHTGQIDSIAGDVVTVSISVTTGCVTQGTTAVCGAVIAAGDS